MSTAEMGTHTRIWVLLIILSLSTTNLINFFIQAEKYSNLHSSTLSETNTNSHSSSSSSNNNNNNNHNHNHNNDNNKNNNNDNKNINSGDNKNDSVSRRSQNQNPSPNGIFVNGVPSNPTGSKQQQLSTASKKKLEDFKEYDCPDHNPSCLKDKENFNAIKTLHDLIDDDRNGNVDQTESDEFLRVELQYTDGFERHFTFHGNDRFISVEDLWKSWKQSEVYNWTVDDVVDWLVHHVELPHYVTNFQTHKIDGSTLPRMAASHQYLSTIGVKNNVHKQKLSLKAMDVVLFGPPKKGHSYIKDLTLIASLIIAIGGCWFAYLQHKYSQAHVKKMMRDWESLQIAEESLKELQERLDKAQQEQNLNDRLKDVEGIEQPDSDIKLLRKQSLDEISRGKIEEELKQVKANLRKAEKELESRQWSSAPADLQKWLQLTYEIELQHHNNKKLAAENQLREARDCCEKLKKKRNAFMGPLRIAHGNSIDEVDKRILNARASLEVVHQDLQERLGRWRAIERLCAFSVTKNSGLASLMQTMHQDKLTPGFPAKTPSSKDLQTFPKNLSSSLNRRSIDTISNHSGGSPISPESEVTFHLGESPPHSLCHEDVVPPPSYSSVNTVVPSGSGKVYSSSGYMPMTKSESLIRNRFDSLISSTSESSLTELDQRKQSESSLRMTGSSVLPLTVEEGCDSETESTESTDDKKKSRKKKVLEKIFRRNGDVKKKS